MKNITTTKKKNRIEILDVIRGFAIFGIVIANIQSWSGYKFISFDAIETLNYYNYDSIVEYFFMFFIDTKFYTLFSLLFGIGFYVQFNKQRDNQDAFMKVYRRRLLFLMLFGAIHEFFWSGDILLIYGGIGFIFVLFRNMKPTNILIYSILIFYSFLLYDLYFAIYFPDILSVTATAHKTFPDISPEQVTSVFQHGNLSEVLKMNWHNLYYRYIDFIPSGKLTAVLSIFLLGFYMMSIDYFNRYARSLKLMLVFFFSGLILTYIAHKVGGSMMIFSHDLKNVAYKAIVSTGQILLALSYVNILSILDKKIAFKKFFHLFAYVGRMSFTSYFMHTFFGYLIFYPFFGGLFGTMGIVEITIVALLIYSFQILFSFLWLKYFNFGPLEWIWRCLTYSKLFPLVRQKN